MIRLPLDESGVIDEAARQAEPGRATVRRFWPQEPDLSGYVLKSTGGWVFSYAIGEQDDENIVHLENHPIRIGEYLLLSQPDGTRYPFQVISAEPV